MVVADHAGQSVYPNGMVVQARYQTELGATLRQKCFFAPHADFFDGLETIRRECGTDDRQPADSGTRQANEMIVGGGLQPFPLAQPRLE